MATTFDVFLCYNSRDQVAVETLAKLLNKRNVQPWLDVWELSPGTPWMECVEDVIKNTSASTTRPTVLTTVTAPTTTAAATGAPRAPPTTNGSSATATAADVI